ncbi:MAG: ankyrin repeat domain-containing protein [Candidatus Margulisbacteria bacterium]|nr:ankyrin repeat domain-containing protein [Candidatus Margulisiibacteriota bacterium]
MYKVISINTVSLLTFLRNKLRDMQTTRKNIFTLFIAKELVRKMIELKEAGVNLCQEFAELPECDVLKNDFKPELDPAKESTIALNSIYHCLKNLNDSNQEKVLVSLAEAFRKLGYKNIKRSKLLFETLKSLMDDEEKFKLMLKMIDNSDINQQDESGRTLLMWAAMSSNVMATEELLKRKADPNILGNENNGALMYSMWDLRISRKPETQIKVTELLVKAGADINQANENGETPLNYSIVGRRGYFFKALVKNYPGNFDSNTKGAMTPLMQFIAHGYHNGDKDMTKLFIDKTININTRESNKGQTVLYMAVNKSDKELLTMLLAREDLDPNIRNNDGCTPLYEAVSQKDEGMVDLLIADRRCDLNISNNSGVTPLMLAAGTLDGKGILLKLIIAGADPDAKDNKGETALMYAVRHGDDDMRQILIIAGADAQLKNKKGQTARDVAKELQYPAIEEFLASIIEE